MPAGLIVLSMASVWSCQHQDRGNLPSPTTTQVQVTTAFPGVVRVIAIGQLCTGVFVSPRALLTAAHCVRPGAEVQIQSESVRIEGSGVIKHGPGTEGDARDLAVVHFSNPVVEKNITYAIGKVEVGNKVHLIGYGCTDSTTRVGTGQKRAGTNVLYRISEYLEVLTPVPAPVKKLLGPSNRAGSCFGDSGGPMFVETGSGYHLVGVDHAVIPEGDEQISAYTDLTRSDNRGFLQRVNTELQLGIEGL